MRNFALYFEKYFLCLILIAASSSDLYADDGEELAKKLANPVASLISVPFQYNYDENYDIDNKGSKQLINIQPVIPIELNKDMNIISRTILPIVDQHNIPDGESDSGIGDTLQSFFFSPKQPGPNGLIWGIGPAINLATASDDNLGSEKWSLGPTFVALKQHGPWTYGVLSNHLWDFAGSDERSGVNATYMQPFFNYITASKTTFTINSESTFNWQEDEWTIPINVLVSQLFKIGDVPMQFGAGPRYWAETPDSGPDDWGARAVFILLFPK